MAKKPPHCPTCNGLPIRYREHWTGAMRRYAATDDGRPAEHEGGIDSERDRVDAECAKGHEWTVRGIRSVQELER